MPERQYGGYVLLTLRPEEYMRTANQVGQTFTRTLRCHRNRGEAPISFATESQLGGPTCAVTAAFITRVGR
jgi:hypothetical protein